MMEQKLEHLHRNISLQTKKGYPILMAGGIIFLLLAIMPYLFPLNIVHLIWVWGLGGIFPLGLLLGKILKIDLIGSKNPLSALGGTVAAPQAFYIPVFILIYMKIPEYLPYCIGLLGGSHFLPYMWIYKSKAYLFVTLAICLSSFILGSFFIELAFILVPSAIAISFAIAVLIIFKENKPELFIEN